MLALKQLLKLFKKLHTHNFEYIMIGSGNEFGKVGKPAVLTYL